MEAPLIYNFMNDDDLLRITNKITEMEKKTAGEICVSIKEKRSFKERNKDISEIALTEFNRLGIANTEGSTGILILIILKERHFYILADKVINDKVGEQTWEAIKNTMQQMFMNGDFAQGILYGVENVGAILIKHFPVKEGDINEISNRVIIK